MKFYIPSHGKPFNRDTPRQYIYGRNDEGYRVIFLKDYPALKLGALMTDEDDNDRRDTKIADGEWMEVKLNSGVTIS